MRTSKAKSQFPIAEVSPPLLADGVSISTTDRTDPPARPRSLDSPHLTETDLARRWQISVRTLQNARVAGTGVPFIRVNSSSVRYRLVDVENFELSRLRRSTSEPVPQINETKEDNP